LNVCFHDVVYPRVVSDFLPFAVKFTDLQCCCYRLMMELVVYSIVWAVSSAANTLECIQELYVALQQNSVNEGSKCNEILLFKDQNDYR